MGTTSPVIGSVEKRRAEVVLLSASCHFLAVEGKVKINRKITFSQYGCLRYSYLQTDMSFKCWMINQNQTVYISHVLKGNWLLSIPNRPGNPCEPPGIGGKLGCQKERELERKETKLYHDSIDACCKYESRLDFLLLHTSKVLDA